MVHTDVGIVVKRENIAAVEMAREMVEKFDRSGIKFCSDRHTSQMLKCRCLEFDDMSQNELDCVLAVGGDGTILSVARQVAKLCIPILGINMGHLGFLAEVDPLRYEEALKNLLKGQYTVEERTMVEATVFQDGYSSRELIALNDIVISKNSFARLLRFDVFVNEEHFSAFQADGVIVSSPTGSTAYSLSAGGPLVSPNIDAMLVTPICAHILSSRPLVVSGDDMIRVELNSSHSDIAITADGQETVKLGPKDVITIRKSPYKTRFVKLGNDSFYKVLKDRLKAGRM